MPGLVHADEGLLHDVLDPVDRADPARHEPAGVPRREPQELVVGGLIAALGARHERAGVELQFGGHENGYVCLRSRPASAGSVPARRLQKPGDWPAGPS